ncbi:hypothetical protein PSPO01_12855 [Paraphaeosphaeria sporulosa]
MKFTQIIAGFALATTTLAIAIPGDCGLNPHANCKRVAIPEPEPADCGPNPHSNCKRTPIPEPEPMPEPSDCGPNPHSNCKRAPAPKPAVVRRLLDREVMTEHPAR